MQSPQNLQKLTKYNQHNLHNKSVCCLEKSISYLDELCKQYDILNSISCMVDSNQRNLGSFLYYGKEITVYNIDYLKNLDWNNTVLLITSDYYKEAYEKLYTILGDIAQNITIYYFANKETEYEEEYRKQYEDFPLDDLIVFRSGPHASSYVKGMDFSDNARALFEYMLEKGYNKKYKLVWFVKNPKEFSRYENTFNVAFVSFDWSVSENPLEREQYYQALCRAKYLFFTDAYGFARNCREDQIRVQLWHGCGFKTRVNFVRCEHRYEYTTVISDLYADIHADIYGLRKEQILVTGYAKQDWLFQSQEKYKIELHMPQADKYVFWLPTFRSTGESLKQLNEYGLRSDTGLPVVSTQKELQVLNELLEMENMVLCIKLHPFQDRMAIHCENCSHIMLIENNTLVENNIQINEILGFADALISDYSSVAVDYMLLDRPIAFMLEDVQEYEASRGFVFENIKDWLPGTEIYSFEDLCRFIKELASGIDSEKDKRHHLLKKMHKYNDNNSCKRILEALNV